MPHDVVRRPAGRRLRADCAPDASSYARPDASPYFPPDSGSDAAAGSAANAQTDSDSYAAADVRAQHAPNTPTDTCSTDAVTNTRATHTHRAPQVGGELHWLHWRRFQSLYAVFSTNQRDAACQGMCLFQTSGTQGV